MLGRTFSMVCILQPRKLRFRESNLPRTTQRISREGKGCAQVLGPKSPALPISPHKRRKENPCLSLTQPQSTVGSPKEAPPQGIPLDPLQSPAPYRTSCQRTNYLLNWGTVAESTWAKRGRKGERKVIRKFSWRSLVYRGCFWCFRTHNPQWRKKSENKYQMLRKP